VKGPQASHRIRVRRERRAAARAARRATIAARVGARRTRTLQRLAIGGDAPIAMCEVDADRYEAALARFGGHRDHAEDSAEDDAEVDVPLFADDDDCPLCRAVDAARIGEPVVLGRGPC
jgi:hypothetical protein